MQYLQAQNIDSFMVAGINYRKGDAAVRGLFAIGQDQYQQLFATAHGYGIKDFFVLSTCNRTEIYGFAEHVERLADLLCSVCAGSRSEFAAVAYKKAGTDAVQHLFNVAAGLDSQILGDYEILGQMKTAVKAAKAAGTIGTFMERLVNLAFQSSKAVKTRTSISGGTVSVSFAAVQYIKEYAEAKGMKPELLKIALVGTGKIGRVTCKNMVDYLRATDITLVNRTEETAKELAKELGLRAAPLSSIPDVVAAADVVLVSASAPVPLVKQGFVEGKGAKLIIDISIPCNVEVGVQQLANVTFADVDALSKITDETLKKREAEVPVAQAIVDEHIAEFRQWCVLRRHVPVIKDLKNRLLGIPFNGMVEKNGGSAIDTICGTVHEERAQKVLNNLASQIRNHNTPGCHYIQAINDFIA